FRSLALPRRNSSIGFGSAHANHSASVIVSPSRRQHDRSDAGCKGADGTPDAVVRRDAYHIPHPPGHRQRRAATSVGPPDGHRGRDEIGTSPRRYVCIAPANPSTGSRFTALSVDGALLLAGVSRRPAGVGSRTREVRSELLRAGPADGVGVPEAHGGGT